MCDTQHVNSWVKQMHRKGNGTAKQPSECNEHELWEQFVRYIHEFGELLEDDDLDEHEQYVTNVSLQVRASNSMLVRTSRNLLTLSPVARMTRTTQQSELLITKTRMLPRLH